MAFVHTVCMCVLVETRGGPQSCSSQEESKEEETKGKETSTKVRANILFGGRGGGGGGGGVIYMHTTACDNPWLYYAFV